MVYIYAYEWTSQSLVQIMDCRHFGANPIIWTNAAMLLFGPLGSNEILIEIQTFSFKKMRLKISSAE